jgi:hypothetical protein
MMIPQWQEFFASSVSKIPSGATATARIPVRSPPLRSSTPGRDPDGILDFWLFFLLKQPQFCRQTGG